MEVHANDPPTKSVREDRRNEENVGRGLKQWRTRQPSYGHAFIAVSRLRLSQNIISTASMVAPSTATIEPAPIKRKLVLTNKNNVNVLEWFVSTISICN